jgi:diaminopimelate decarboxylase
MIDIGGGFPGIDPQIGVLEKETKSNPPATFEMIAKSIQDGITEFFHEYPDMQFIAEPGRYFAEPSHTLVMNIIGKKKIVEPKSESNPETSVSFVYYLNDGIYGSFNCIFFDHSKPVVQPFNERDGKLHKSRLFGPTCDSIDLIADEIMLPELAIGEWVYVENFGAYTVAASSHFNGFYTNICKYISRSN